MGEYSATLFCSFVANVTGIKFYEGHLHLQSVMRVLFEREFSNPHDSNAILVKLVLPEDCVILGHLERRVSSTIAPLMDRNLAGFIMRGCVSIESAWCSTLILGRYYICGWYALEFR